MIAMEALKYFILSNNSSDNAEEIDFLNKAVQIDEEFVYAHIGLYGRYLITNNQEGFLKHLSHALKNINKLTEEYKIFVRIDESILDQKHHREKEKQILDMWIELYPEAIKPLQMLAERHEINSEPDKAIYYYKKILEIAPEMHEYLLSIGFSVGLHATQ